MTGVVVPVATEIGAVPDTLVTVPVPPVALIVIEPAPFVIATPEPAVNVALVKVLPVELPISSWPSV